MINCVIIDDDPTVLRQLEHYIAEYENTELLASFSDSIEAVNFLRKNRPYINLIFLDINMPKLNGIQLMEAVPQLPPIAIISSTAEFALESFSYDVLHYLLKPISFAGFLKVIDRFTAQTKRADKVLPQFLFFKDQTGVQKISFENIKYIEAMGDYVKIISDNKTYVVNTTLKKFEEKLTLFPEFVRVHRSHIVNLKYFENMDSDVIVISGTGVPIGSKYKHFITEKLNFI